MLKITQSTVTEPFKDDRVQNVARTDSFKAYLEVR